MKFVILNRLIFLSLILAVFFAFSLVLLTYQNGIDLSRIGMISTPFKTETHQGEGTDRRLRFPDVVIAGVRKGGTGTLKSILRGHSKVLAFPWEPHFFDKAMPRGRGYDWYLRLGKRVATETVVIEKTPKYFQTPGVPAMIQHMGASVIIMLRDPIKRIISDCEHQRLHHMVGNKTMTNEEQILDDQGNINKTAFVVLTSTYSMHMAEWLFHFELGKTLHIVDGDNFASKPWEELEKVQDFLKIPREIKREHFHFVQEKGFYCFHEKNDTHLFERCRKRKDKGRKHQPLSEDLKAKLATFFRPFNKQLFKMLGRSFRWQT